MFQPPPPPPSSPTTTTNITTTSEFGVYNVLSIILITLNHDKRLAYHFIENKSIYYAHDFSYSANLPKFLRCHSNFIAFIHTWIHCTVNSLAQWIINLLWCLSRWFSWWYEKITFIIKNPKNRLLPIFSPDFTLNGQIGLFYAEKWIFLKKLGTLLKKSQIKEYGESYLRQLSCQNKPSKDFHYSQGRLYTSRLPWRTQRPGCPYKT